MLLSIVNMKLRDEGITLSELCSRWDMDQAELTRRLAAAGFAYSASANRFC